MKKWSKRAGKAFGDGHANEPVVLLCSQCWDPAHVETAAFMATLLSPAAAAQVSSVVSVSGSRAYKPVLFLFPSITYTHGNLVLAVCSPGELNDRKAPVMCC